MRNQLWLGAIVLLVFTASWSGSRNPTEPSGPSTDRLERVGDYLRAMSDRGEVAGSVSLVMRHGQIAHFEAYGWADIASGRPMQKNSIMRIFSMTKPITCVAALILVDEGKLSLSDPVSKYLPEFSSPRVIVGEEAGRVQTVPAEREITIQMLASHTSGVGYSPSPDQYPISAKLFSDSRLFDPTQTLERTVATLAHLPLQGQPGTTWRYGMSIDVLARVVEVISGQPFGQFLQERIFDPLGMSDTGFIVPEADWDRVATIYSPNGSGELVEKAEDENHFHGDFKDRRQQAGGHGLMSTVMDYTRFAEMLLNKGVLDDVRILSPQSVELMATDVLGDSHEIVDTRMFNGKTFGFGLGVRVVKEAAAGTAFGSAGTFSWSGRAMTFFFVDPAEDLVMVLMAQHIQQKHQAYKDLSNLIYQAIVR